ncbi:MAG: hypothetical protein IJF39_02915 [Clostridia bacterium]|nr:hypothetical protein [Clostridia bacterium]
MKKQFTQEEINEKEIQPQEFFEEVRAALKDLLVAKLHTSNSSSRMYFKFPNGQVFVVATWEDK